MNIAVVVNFSKKGSVETLRAIQEKLAKYQDVSFFVYQDVQSVRSPDLIFVVGGDGTMLSTVQKAVSLDVPVICFNTGKIGFLAEVSEIRFVDDAIDRILRCEYGIEERALLQVKTGSIETYALNEVCISKNDYSSVIKTSIACNSQNVTSFFADGILVSTPTGSTAYSLSANGPILSPTMRAMLLTPVCAHVLFSRPMVFGENDELTLNGESTNGANVVVDGKIVAKIELKGSVIVKMSQKKLKLIKLYNQSFYTKLQKKLLQWTVENND